MKKFLLAGSLLSLLGTFGCSSDDTPNGPGTDPIPTVQVTALSSAPNLTAVGDNVWNTLPITGIDISTLNAPKEVPAKIASMTDSIWVQAGTFNDSLYLKIWWNDGSHDIMADAYRVLDTITGNATWDHDLFRDEDHLLVMFAGLPNDAWDTWHWRSLTTAYSYLAEGQTFSGGILTPDNDTSTMKAVWENEEIPGTTLPSFIHEDASAFTGQILYRGDEISLTGNTTGWTIGDLVPGWMVDTSTYKQPESLRRSRWDIRSTFEYNIELNRYTVVMCRPMAGYSDDLSFTVGDTVTSKIGITDDLDDIGESGSGRGFTKQFLFIF